MNKMDGWSDDSVIRGAERLETVPLISASPARFRLARKEKILRHHSGHYELSNYSPLGKINFTVDALKEKCESPSRKEKRPETGLFSFPLEVEIS